MPIKDFDEGSIYFEYVSDPKPWEPTTHEYYRKVKEAGYAKVLYTEDDYDEYVAVAIEKYCPDTDRLQTERWVFRICKTSNGVVYFKRPSSLIF